MKSKTKPFSISIEEEVLEDIKKLAEKEDRSVSYLINRILKEYTLANRGK
jgi:hypothetical protein